MSAPDRIWIEAAPQFPAKIPPFPSWNDDEADPSMNQTVEYRRADLCDPMQDERVKALVDALRKVIEEYDEFLKDEYMRGLSSLDDEIHDARAALRDMGVKS